MTPRVASEHVSLSSLPLSISIIAINPRSAVPADAGHADKLRRAFEATRKASAMDLEEGKIRLHFPAREEARMNSGERSKKEASLGF